MDGLLLLLKLKPRSAYDVATAAYQRFADLYNAGRLAEGWPVLAEISWVLHSVDRSDDWALRDLIEPMLPAVLDLQTQLLERFSSAAVES